MKRIWHLMSTSRRNAIRAIEEAPEGYRVTLAPPSRSLEQNAALWGALTDISEQVEWYGRHLTAEDWKCIFTAALRQQDVVPGLNGGFVVLGLSTSKMTKAEFGDLLDLIGAFAAEHGVQLGEVAA